MKSCVSGEMKPAQIVVNVFCSVELTGGSHNQVICLSAINLLLAITAITGNTLILFALHKESRLHQPSKALLRNLVATDICVGFVQLASVGYWVSIVQEQWKTCHSFYFIRNIGAIVSVSVSLYTISAISVDRLLALLLGLRYRQVLILRRVRVVALVFWVCPGVISAVIWIVSLDAWKIWSAMNIAVCLITSTYCYTRIFRRLRHHQTQVHSNSRVPQNQAIPLNVTRYRKTVSNALWLQFALVFCFLPYLLLAPFALREIEYERSSGFYSPFSIAMTLMFFNSTLNPILYCWKIKEVRKSMTDVLFCSRM